MDIKALRGDTWRAARDLNNPVDRTALKRASQAATPILRIGKVTSVRRCCESRDLAHAGVIDFDGHPLFLRIGTRSRLQLA